MRGKSSFTSAQKEVFAAFVSGLNACSFCYGSHAAVADHFGIPAKTIEALIEDIDNAPIASNEKPLFHSVTLILSPSKLIQEDADKIFREGWSEQDLQDLILNDFFINFYNRLLDGYGIKGNQAIYEFGGAHLYKNGYNLTWFIV